MQGGRERGIKKIGETELPSQIVLEGSLLRRDWVASFKTRASRFSSLVNILLSVAKMTAVIILISFSSSLHFAKQGGEGK